MKTLRDRIIEEEGLKLFPYKDNAKTLSKIDNLPGIWTIGIGHNIEADPDMMMHFTQLQAEGITKQRAFELFDKDVQAATDDLQRALPWTSTLDWPRKSVLIDMVFNMGLSKLLGFKQTLAAVESGEWQFAASHMLDSAWAKQVGKRASNLAEIMRTGEGVA